MQGARTATVRAVVTRRAAARCSGESLPAAGPAPSGARGRARLLEPRQLLGGNVAGDAMPGGHLLLGRRGLVADGPDPARAAGGEGTAPGQLGRAREGALEDDPGALTVGVRNRHR